MTRVHITGASGSGTTTLGAALAGRHDARHLDADDFFWLPTDPPFTSKRPKDVRNRLLVDALEGGEGAWVLSRSIAGWESGVEAQFDCVVFLWVPTEIRLERLRRREAARFGEAALALGGALHEGHAAFLEWAARYDTVGLEQRSRVKHEAWLATLSCHIVYIEGDTTVDERVTRILAELAGRW